MSGVAPVPTDPFVGRVLGGAYRITARLGEGASGVVYRARHVLLEQDFAVKVLAPALAQDPDVRRRLLLEARSLTLFTHKHAVQVRHCGEDDGVLYLAMDLCRNETLARLLEREGPLPEARATAIVLQVLEALAEAHRAGIVHRDLKPSNVMVETVVDAGGREEDRVRVLDFGLARIVGAEGRALPNALASVGGSVVGTVAYMSPEQLRAEDEVDGRSDLFSVGVVLHELLGGALPFQATSTLSIAMRILEREPLPLPREGPRGVSPALSAVVARALEKDPARRFQTADDFADALRAALGGVAPKPLPRRRTAGEPRRARPALVATLALVALGAAAWLLLSPTSRPGFDAAGTRRAAAAALEEGRYAQAIDAYGALVAAGAARGEDHLGRARARIATGDPGAEADLAQAAHALGASDPRVWTEKARFLWRVAKKPDEARTAFARALQSNDRHAPARLERAQLFLAEGRYDDAARDLDAAAALPVEDPGLLSLLRARVASGRASATPSDAPERAEALRLADAAVAADPRSAEAQALRGSLLAGAGWAARGEEGFDAMRAHYAEALVAETRAIELATSHPGHRAQGRLLGRLHLDRASTRLTVFDEAGAVEDYETALRLLPDDPDVLAGAANAWTQLGRFEQAFAAFERLADLTGDAEHLNGAAFALQRQATLDAQQGRRAAAVAGARRAIDAYGRALARGSRRTWVPYRAETHVLLAQLVRGPERDAALASAKADLDEAAKAAPQSRDVAHRVAELHAVAGDARAALEAARRAARPRDPDGGVATPAMSARAAQYAIALARAEAEAGRVGAAETLYDEAAARADEAARVVDSPGPLILRGEARARRAGLRKTRGERRAAMEAAYADLRKAVDVAKDDLQGKARALATLGEAALLAEEPDEAARSLRQALDLRDAEVAAGRWNASAAWWRLLEDAAARADRADEAATARAKAEALEKATEAEAG